MELIRTEIQYCEPSYTALSGFSESTDAIVPDSFPDIGRIVCADGAASVKDELPQTDRILVSGMVNTVVLYQPEGEEGLRRLTIPLSFAHIEEARGVNADSVCFVRCRVGSVSARAVNSRKVSVTAQLYIETDVYEHRTAALTERIDPQADALEILTGSASVPLLRNAAAKEFTLLDDIEIPGGQALELICTHCTLGAVECQPMNGRVILKGEAKIHALTQDDTGAFQTMQQPVPFAQVIDAEESSEGKPVRVRLAVRSLDCMMTESGVLSLGVGLRALLLWEEPVTVSTIRDLYHVHNQLDIQERRLELHGCHLGAPFTAEGSISVPVSRPAADVIRADAVCAGVQDTGDGQLRLNAQVNILYRDADGQICSVSRQTPCTLQGAGLLSTLTPQDISLQATASPGGDSALHLHLSASGCLIDQPVLTLRDITNLSAGAHRVSQTGDATLVLRYIQAPEALWEIAKQYASTVQAIRRANALSEQTESVSGAMLLIPVYSR